MAAAGLRPGRRRAAAAQAGAALSGALTTSSASRARASRISTGGRSTRTSLSGSRGSSRERRMGPTIVVFPDCFTSLGGNQYVNSSAIGRYADYLTHELIPFVDRRVPHARVARPSRAVRQVVGRLWRDHSRDALPAEYWGAVADHSGDALFDFCYFTDWPRTLNELDRHRRRGAHAGPRRRAARRARTSIAASTTAASQRFLEHVWAKGKARRRRSARADEPRDGRDLRSRSEGPRSASGCRSTSRPASSFRRGGAVAAQRSGQSCRVVQAQSQDRCAASTSTAAGATSIICTTARGCCPSG